MGKRPKIGDYHQIDGYIGHEAEKLANQAANFHRNVKHEDVKVSKRLVEGVEVFDVLKRRKR